MSDARILPAGRYSFDSTMHLFSRKKLHEVRAIIALGIVLALLMVGAQFSTGYARQLLDRLDLMLYDLRFNVLLPRHNPLSSSTSTSAA